MTKLFLFLLCAHVLGDFLFQTDWVARNKHRFGILLLHVAFLWGIAFFLHRIGFGVESDGIYKPLVWAAGFVAVLQGSGVFVSKVTKRMIDENELSIDGLKGGGKMIGQLERTLIFLLMVIGQPAGIGFLVAAKSILRFEEAKKQKLAEYVLIGTLLSFSLAIAFSFLTIKAVTFY